MHASWTCAVLLAACQPYVPSAHPASSAHLVKHAADGQRALGDGRHLVGQLHGCRRSSTPALGLGCKRPTRGQTGQAACGRHRAGGGAGAGGGWAGAASAATGERRRLPLPHTMRYQPVLPRQTRRSSEPRFPAPPHLVTRRVGASDRLPVASTDRCSALTAAPPLPRASDRLCSRLPAPPAWRRRRRDPAAVHQLPLEAAGLSRRAGAAADLAPQACQHAQQSMLQCCC